MSTYDSNASPAFATWGERARARVSRLSQVVSILGRFGFMFILHELDLFPRPRQGRIEAAMSRLEMPERLREALEELGPTAIKLGQLLSSRPDIIAEPYVRELSKLRDAVPPQPVEQVRQIIQEELKAEIETLFAEFDLEPRASASIGQVHFARLHDGSPVAVKVQRQNVAEAIEIDLDIILWAARQAERSITWAADNRIHEVAQQFAYTLRQELNFLIEANNTQRLQDNLAEEENAYVPVVHWDLSTRRVLVIEWVEGAKVGEPEQLQAAGVDNIEAAKTFAALMLRQILRDGYFHGDPHAGNVLFPGGARVAFLDCGNCVAIDRAVRDNLVTLLLAALNDEPQEVTDCLLLLGAAGERTDLQQLSNDIGRMLSQYAGFRNTAQAGLGQFLDQMLGLVLRHGVRMQPSLAAIAKSLMVVEGICLQLDQNFDSQALVRQEAQNLIIERLKPLRLVNDLLRVVKSTNRYAGALPRQISQVLQRMQGGGVRVRLVHENIDRPLHRLDLMINRIAFALVVSAVIVSSTNIVTNGGNLGPIGRWVTGAYMIVGIVLGGWLLFSILRSGRL